MCPTSKEEAVLAVASEGGPKIDIDEDGTVQTSAFKAEETGEWGDDFSKMGDGGLAWKVGEEACICDSGASTHMTPSTDQHYQLQRVQPKTAHRRRFNPLDPRMP